MNPETQHQDDRDRKVHHRKGSNHRTVWRAAELPPSWKTKGKGKGKPRNKGKGKSSSSRGPPEGLVYTEYYGIESDSSTDYDKALDDRWPPSAPIDLGLQDPEDLRRSYKHMERDGLPNFGTLDGTQFGFDLELFDTYPHNKQIKNVDGASVYLCQDYTTDFWYVVYTAFPDGARSGPSRRIIVDKIHSLVEDLNFKPINDKSKERPSNVYDHLPPIPPTRTPWIILTPTNRAPLHTGPIPINKHMFTNQKEPENFVDVPDLGAMVKGCIPDTFKKDPLMMDSDDEYEGTLEERCRRQAWQATRWDEELEEYVMWTPPEHDVYTNLMKLPRNRLYLLADMLHIPYLHRIGQYKVSKDNIIYWKIVQETGSDIAVKIVNSKNTEFYHTGRTSSSLKQLNFGLNLMWEKAIFLTSIDQLLYQNKVGVLLNWLQTKPKLNFGLGHDIPQPREWKWTTPKYPDDIA